MTQNNNKELDAVAPSESTGQTVGTSISTPPAYSQEMPAYGKRIAFRDIGRKLSDEDFASPGVQKLILDELERADAECEQVKSYIERFHEADKKASILEERLNSSRAVEVLFGLGVGLGGAIMGLAPFFWNAQTAHGEITIAIGILLIVGSTIARMIKK